METKYYMLMVIIALFIGCRDKENGKKAERLPQKDNTLSEIEKKEGWILLFDGQSKKEFHVYNNKTDGSAWKTKDGMLYLDASQKDGWQIKGGGDLVTNSEYENFHLKLDWKISKGGNSGIIFYVKESPQLDYPWMTGPEMQILDNERHSDAKIKHHRAGDLYDLLSAPEGVVNPAESWNSVEIICNLKMLTFRMNGKNVISTKLWDTAWKEMIAKSKFSEFPQFGTVSRGHIVIQDHGDSVWFKNIKIKPL